MRRAAMIACVSAILLLGVAPAAEGATIAKNARIAPAASPIMRIRDTTTTIYTANIGRGAFDEQLPAVNAYIDVIHCDPSLAGGKDQFLTATLEQDGVITSQDDSSLAAGLIFCPASGSATVQPIFGTAALHPGLVRITATITQDGQTVSRQTSYSHIPTTCAPTPQASSIARLNDCSPLGRRLISALVALLNLAANFR
jgi:hypothetical protein